MSPKAAAIRLAAYYAALFAAVGIHLPFWPLWLQNKGLNASEIGVIAATAYVSKIAINPIIGHMVDRRGDRRLPMLALAGGATLTWLTFALTDGFAAILAVTVIAAGLWTAIIPVGESMAMMIVGHYRLDYGRIRLWGSAAFIASAVLVGRVLNVAPPSILMWLIAAGLTLTAVTCAALPDLRAPPPQDGRPAALRPLLVSPAFLLFLAAASLNQAAHTVYYAFSTIHWKNAGISDSVIGLLWSEGVLAEILLFAFSGPVVRRLGPGRLLMIAAGLGVLRWSLLGATTELPLLIAAQTLHAATFGCAHLGAMHFIQRAVPLPLSARAQGVLSSVASGIAPGLMSPLSGRLFDSLGGHAFLVMAALSLLSAVAAWGVSRRWHGGPVVDV